jgi:hypothetical protein
MKMCRTFLTLAYVTTIVLTSSLSALPHTIVLRNATATTQRVWIRCAYTVKQALTERKEMDLIVREITPRDSLVYGDRHHTFEALEIKLNPTVSFGNLTTATGGVAINVADLEGTKSIVTITGQNTYEIDSKGTTHARQQAKETEAALKQEAQETAAQAIAEAQQARETAKTQAEKAAHATRSTAQRVRDTAAQTRDDVTRKAKAMNDTIREKAHATADKARDKAHDAKEAVVDGLARAENKIREKTANPKEAIANNVARAQNRAAEAQMAASGRWAKIKAGVYNWWCNVKITLSRIFRR